MPILADSWTRSFDYVYRLPSKHWKGIARLLIKQLIWLDFLFLFLFSQSFKPVLTQLDLSRRVSLAHKQRYSRVPCAMFHDYYDILMKDVKNLPR